MYGQLKRAVLPLQYKTCDRIINVHQQNIVFNDETVKVRPKTFSLLLCFLQNPFQVLSKKQLLDTVWDDVEVNEQVLFQTIRELRQLFGEEEVIKTHPRKGYAWVADVEEAPDKKPPVEEKPAVNEKPPSGNSNETPPLKPARKRPTPLLAFSLSIMVCLVVYFGLVGPQAVSANLQGSLVILPMQNNIQDSDHQWVYLGAMDQLITALQSTEKLAVMNTDYVLEIIKDADITSTPRQQDISRIFEVSGASLVVQSQLSGTTQDYRLKYTFHFKNDKKRGVIFGNNLNDALQQLASKIAVYTGQSLNVPDHQLASEFGNEILVRALELQEKRDDAGAVKLYNTLLQVEPNNVTARRLLARSYLSLSQYDLAKTHLLEAITLTQSHNAIELPRIHLGLAWVEVAQANYDAAKEQLLIADAFAIDNNDWLYRAYIAQLQGLINRTTKQFEQAYSDFDNALSYHGVIQCPIGTSVVLLDLTSLAIVEGKTDKAEQYLNRAASIINNRKLTLLEKRLAHTQKILVDNQ